MTHFNVFRIVEIKAGSAQKTRQKSQYDNRQPLSRLAGRGFGNAASIAGTGTSAIWLQVRGSGCSAFGASTDSGCRNSRTNQRTKHPECA
jgi:hypothetical protein